jgi:hypothetical protein
VIKLALFLMVLRRVAVIVVLTRQYISYSRLVFDMCVPNFHLSIYADYFRL